MTGDLMSETGVCVGYFSSFSFDSGLIVANEIPFLVHPSPGGFFPLET